MSTESTKVLVCGSPTFADFLPIDSVLYGLRELGRLGFLDDDLTVIEDIGSGAENHAPHGAQRFAAQWAEANSVEHETYTATTWQLSGSHDGQPSTHQPFGTAVDLVVAFVDQPLAETTRAARVVSRAQRVGLPTWVITVGGQPTAGRSRLAR